MNDEWISVDEGLPEYEYTNGIDVHKFVFVHSKQYGVVEAQFRGFNQLDKMLQWAMIVENEGKYFYDATHWQPKAYPKPPEVEQEKVCGDCVYWIARQDNGWCKQGLSMASRAAFGCPHEEWKAKEPEQSCKNCARPLSVCNTHHRWDVTIACEFWQAIEAEHKNCSTCAFGLMCVHIIDGHPVMCCEKWTAKESEQENLRQIIRQILRQELKS